MPTRTPSWRSLACAKGLSAAKLLAARLAAETRLEGTLTPLRAILEATWLERAVAAALVAFAE
jgi:hypothetical protein